jgi:hypothetical protein
MYKEPAVLLALIKVYTIPYHDRGHINVMLVFHRCTDSLQVMPGSSNETFPISDHTYHIGDMNVEEEGDMKEEGEVNMKTEQVIGSEEEECMDIKDEEGIYSEEEKEEAQDMDAKEEEEVDVQEEVS